MILIGIDPGLSGAIATIRHRDGGRGVAVAVQRMPATWPEIADLIILEASQGDDVRVVVEQLGPMPSRRRPAEEGGQQGDEMRGSIAAWKLCSNLHLTLGILIALKVPFEGVPPQTWQKGLGIAKGTKGPDRKRALVSIARQRFPLSNPTLGTADALLIAEYGWKRWMALEGSARGGVT